MSAVYHRIAKTYYHTAIRSPAHKFRLLRMYTTTTDSTRQREQLIDQWKKRIASQSLIAHDTVTPSPLNLLANTLNEPTISYRQDTLPTHGTIVPATWHHVYFPPRTPEADLADDGYESEFFPPSPFTQRMWAGATLTYNHHNHSCSQHPLRVGDHLTMKTYLHDCEFRSSSRLGDAVFVYLNKDIYLNNGREDPWIMREQRCLVYATDQSDTVSTNSVKIRKIPEFSMEVSPSSVLLFRYSALTFNAHKIHYDQQYTKTREHHPACLVHGPLSSTWMISLLRTYLASEGKIELDLAIDSFSYRCLAPLYVNQPFTVCGRRSTSHPHHFDLWITNHTQHLAVKGMVTLNPSK